MKAYISDLVANEEVISFFLVSELPQVRKTKKDKPYLCLKLQDKTGDLECRMWDIPTTLDPNSLVAGSIVKVQAMVSVWNDENQLQISQMRLTNESDELELGDFYERSERPPAEMLSELIDVVANSLPAESQIKHLIWKVLEQNRSAFLEAPAGKSVHHNYIGGLLEHVLSLCHTAQVVSPRYGLRLDLMLAACIFHDIGKVRELTYPVMGYTVEGNLIGHVSIGMMMVAKAMDEVGDFDPKLRIEVMHLIVSHHGLLEWGSPKIPLMKEAIAFHLIDAMDAKMAICDRAFKKGVDAQGLTEWSKSLGGPLYRGSAS